VQDPNPSSPTFVIWKPDTAGTKTTLDELPALNDNVQGGYVYIYRYICDAGLESGSGTILSSRVLAREVYRSDNNIEPN